MDYISKPALMGKLTSSEEQNKIKAMTGEEAYNEFLMIVNSTEKANVAPVRHGRWVVTQEFNDILGQEVVKFTCSSCGEYRLSCTTLSHETNYCHNCGAYMGDADNGE